jgi:hypothetical protein
VRARACQVELKQMRDRLRERWRRFLGGDQCRNQVEQALQSTIAELEALAGASHDLRSLNAIRAFALSLESEAATLPSRGQHRLWIVAARAG